MHLFFCASTTVIPFHSCLSKKSIHCLQLIQNAAARLSTGTRKFEHITPILASLHWLPFSDFKISLITYKAISGLAPSYISDLLDPYVPSRPLRSSDKGLLIVPTCNYKTTSERAFAFRAPTLWNALPEEIRLAESLNPVLNPLLKTHLYRAAFNP